jgi:transcriptional regulator GlxA family with amidase domain
VPGAKLGARAHATVQLLTAEMREQAGDAVLSRLIDVLLIYVLRAWGESVAPAGTAASWLVALRDPAIAVALARVHEQPSRDWTVADLAAEAGASRSVFARQFTTSVGEPPLAYVTRWRMTLAARLLVDTALPMAAVAARVGYASEHAFSRAFSRVKGRPPGQWRSELSTRSSAARPSAEA